MAFTRLLLIQLLLCAACMKAPDPSGLSTGATARPAVRPTLTLEVPADWQAIPPDLEFYLNKWLLPDGAVATISWLGPDGSKEFIVQNVQRWLAEWTTATGEPVTEYAFAKEPNGGMAMHRLELTGTLQGVRQLGGGDPRADWSLDGIVIESPSGPLFFKLIGPKDAVAQRRDAVWHTLASLVLH